jgi:acetate kinase
MRILCLNVGSSSLKWSLLEMAAETLLAGGEQPLDPTAAKPVDLSAIASQAGAVDAVAHRLVHGGGRFLGATRVDDTATIALEGLRNLDPLHAPRALACIAAARRTWPSCPHVACFDTTFHATLPASAFTYALPWPWTDGWGLRRYGFHGLSVAFAVRRTAQLLGALPERLLVCHLGSGSSITAVRAGHSVDTTMGFTPLEGVPMATRSGSVDPGLLLYVMRQHGLTRQQVEDALEQQSGLRGLGGSADLREILRAADGGDEQAALAYAVWLAGVRRGFGAMLAALDGLDGVVFTGGIGEHQPRARTDILAPFRWCGIELDEAHNANPEGDAIVSSDHSKITVLRIVAREDLTMAREASQVVQR